MPSSDWAFFGPRSPKLRTRRLALLAREPSTRKPASSILLSQQRLGRNPFDARGAWVQSAHFDVRRAQAPNANKPPSARYRKRV